ncbi:MAG TPA: hypothetical protein VHO25_18430 [Polyangiaceae bacterium]|nr:hypothetical protein [Polyangiaceae bacterium]
MKRTVHLGLLGVVLAIAACSADEAAAPAPTFTTPGAFLAAQNGPHEYMLARTLDRLALGQDLVVVTRYAPVVRSLDEARELAQSAEIPILDAAFIIPLAELENGNWEVVWFRSLTEEEKEPL